MGTRFDKLMLQGLITIGVIALAACGSGGGSDDASVDDTQGSWVKDNFLPSSTFMGRCVSPRSGIDPDTGELFIDRLGTREDENNWLRSMSNELYLWYDEIEDRDPSGFTDSIAYFELLKTNATTPSGSAKDRFHFSESTEMLRSEKEIGYGIQWGLLSAPDELPREAVVAYLDIEDDENLPNTITRGAKVISVDGIDLAYGEDVDTLNNGMWPSEPDEVHTFEILPLGATETVEVTLASKLVESDPVQHVKVETTNSGRKVGYILFNDHLGRAEGQLITEVRDLVPQNIDELVLDLRYNRGGYLDLAAELAYMIAGDVSVGQPFENIRFNDKHPEINPVTGESVAPTPFHTTAVGITDDSLEGESLPTLNLTRLFVLTGGNTCSSSEAIINGLRGIDIEVIQIGGATCGKPYGFYDLDNCGTTYFTIQFAGSNAKGFGEYTDGFFPGGTSHTGAELPGCEVGDDFNHLLGETNEARFATALNYIETGECGSFEIKAFSDSGISEQGLEPNVRIPKPIYRSSRIMVK
ncbi:S41 family peptidase [Microbulbifer sp. GL-2]|uniref:S41 family peptidase n=1 Tax=Microbulbifer sp. GL-2 TaxID=2591606 RepID=UPI0011631ACA|nr:S41 family peptidase [Microbulbifer sp. GL-2]BBM02036.1 peptidase S41 [Microbulbifer sp. GL-2]